MRSVLIIAAAVAAIGGPAAADFGKVQSPQPGFQKPKPAIGGSPAASPHTARPTPAYGSTYGASPSASKPRTYGAPPVAEPYKPYQPYKSQPGTSIFGPDGQKKR